LAAGDYSQVYGGEIPLGPRDEGDRAERVEMMARRFEVGLDPLTGRRLSKTELAECGQELLGAQK
jgi:hypothetical protein